jgi:hypothetical protein
VPSRECRPEGPKYGKEAYFVYSGRHQVYMNFQPSPPFAASCKSWQGFCGWRSKMYVLHCISLCAYKNSQQTYIQKTIIFENSIAKSLD